MLITISDVLLNIFYISIIVWFIVLILAVVTLSRRSDIIKPVKIFWAAVIFFAPVVGLILYFAFSFKKRNRNINRY